MKYYTDGINLKGKCYFVVINEEGKEWIQQFDTKITEKEVELASILKALELAKYGDTIFSDSYTGTEDIGSLNKYPEIIKHLTLSCEILSGAKSVKIKWISREQNLAAVKIDGGK